MSKGRGQHRVSAISGITKLDYNVADAPRTPRTKHIRKQLAAGLNGLAKECLTLCLFPFYNACPTSKEINVVAQGGKYAI